jgi:two-component sensor histidine kinase/CheY-like chemotaxis protein
MKQQQEKGISFVHDPRNSLSIRTWLMAVVAATIFPMLFFGAWLAKIEYDRTREASILQLLHVSRALLQATEREFQHREGILLALAATPALQDGDLETFHKLSESIVSRMPPTSGIILADRSGQQIINTRRPYGTPLPRRGDMTPVNKVFETGKTWVSDLFVGALMSIPVVGIDIPVFRDGQVIYDLALSVPIQALDSILAEQRFPEGWIAVIVDRSGTVVSRNTERTKWIGQKMPDAEQTVILSSEGHRDGTLDQIPMLTAWSRSPEWGWAVAISQPQQQIHASVISDLAVLFVAGTLALALGVLLASLISRRISVATADLASSAALLGTRNYHSREKTRIKEIDSVSMKLTDASQLLHQRDLQRDAAEDHQRLLMAELDHRVKNILATVQALARQSLGRVPAAESFIGRVMALAQAHNVLATTQWRGAKLGELVDLTLAPYRDETARIETVGPDIILDAKATQALSLVIHELAVNASKYGALSQRTGRLKLSWQAQDENLQINWIETDGPVTQQPDKKGFGSRLMELSIVELGGTLDRRFETGGLTCRIDIPLGATNRVAEVSSLRMRDDFPASSNSQSPSLINKTIMLVEDSVVVADDLAAVLRRSGATVLGPAATVTGAIDILSQSIPDVVILDINLQNELSFPVADKLRDLNIPFIFISGYGDPQVWPPHLRAELRLAKPVAASDLLVTLSALLDDDRRRRR